MIKNKYDIAIVGSGLVGSIAALLLAQYDFKILLLDAAPKFEKKFSNLSKPMEQPPGLRMSAITLKSQEILEELNIWQKISTRRGLMQKVQAWEEQGPSDIILDSILIGQNHLATIIENNYLLEIINNEIKNIDNITVIRPCSIKNIFLNKKNVNNITSEIELDINGNLNTFLASLIIGSDGANSWLRNYFKFDCEVESYEHYALVTNIFTEKKHNNTAYQKFLKQGPVALLPWAQDDCCSIVWSQDENQAKKMQACSEEEFNRSLEQVVDSKLGKVLKSDQRVVFPLIKRHVKNYYKDNTVLVGDAAHTIHPLAGQGLNLGIYDVYELSKILGDAKRKNKEINNSALLNKYELTRKGHNQQMLNLMGLFKELYNQQNQDSRPISLLRNIGVTLVNNFSFIKKQMTRFAAGYY